jgi:putative SOS response-associated peptidase YedK
MCGRYTNTLDAMALAVEFNAQWLTDQASASWRPRFNIAPDQFVPVIRQRNLALDQGQSSRGSHQRVIEHMQWGFVFAGVDKGGVSKKVINARSESVDEKPMFKKAFAQGRCLVPSDGFYEWDGAKVPHRSCLAGGKPFAFAGLWQEHRDPNGQAHRSFIILTRDALGDLRTIHHRMPVILQASDFDSWLQVDTVDVVRAKRLLLKPPQELPRSYQVSKRVNSPKIDDAECLKAHTDTSEEQLSQQVKNQQKSAQKESNKEGRDQLTFFWNS